MYTLCQRLTQDPNIGFNYDYMGSAEYEFGANWRARVYLAKAEETVLVSGRVKEGKRSVSCVFIMKKGDEQKAIPVMRALADGTNINKGAMMYDKPPAGWLILDPVPMLCYLDGSDGKERAEKFMANTLEQMAEVESYG